jgi:hypothetical protein
VGMVVLAAFHVWWVAEFRHGYPLDVDEAGYTAIGVTDYIAFKGVVSTPGGTPCRAKRQMRRSCQR